MAAEVVAAVITDVELMKASQIGMKALGAGISRWINGYRGRYC